MRPSYALKKGMPGLKFGTQSSKINPFVLLKSYILVTIAGKR